jgi:uncharacterized protein YndB with AHSA1/START domain
MTSDDMATVLRDGDRVGLRYHRPLRHPPEKVWRAITESTNLRHWLPCDIVGERRAGADIELPFWPDQVETYELEQPVLTGRILTWEPTSVFEWTWEGDVLRFELAPRGGGTDLTFTTWFADPDVAGGAGAGYHICLDHLARLLDGDTGRALTDPVVRTDVEQWEPRYAELVASSR